MRQGDESNKSMVGVNGTAVVNRELYGRIPAMVVVMDTDHTILDINETAAKAAGKAKGDCIGSKFWDLYDNPESSVKHAIRILGNIANGNYAQDLEDIRRAQLSCKNDALTPALVRTMEAIDAMARDAEMLTKAGEEGKLSTRADASKHQGVYRKIVQGVNDTLDGVIGPLNLMATYVDRIGRGDVPERISDNLEGDFDAIKNNLNACIDGLGGLVEANQVLQRIAQNDCTVRVADTYQGIFADVARTTNLVADRITNVARVMKRVASGDYDREFAEMKKVGSRSEHDELVPAFLAMMDAVDGVVANTKMLAKAAVEGKLGTRVDVSKLEGKYREAVQGINETLDAVVAPMQETGTVLQMIAQGDLTAHVEGDYHLLGGAFRSQLADERQRGRDLQPSQCSLGGERTGLHEHPDCGDGYGRNERQHQGDSQERYGSGQNRYFRSADCGKHQCHGRQAGRIERGNRQGGQSHHVNRAADKPAGFECHHRGSARRGSGEGVCRGGPRGQGTFQGNNQGDGRYQREDRGDSGEYQGSRAGDRTDYHYHQSTERHFQHDRQRRGRADCHHQRDLSQRG